MGRRPRATFEFGSQRTCPRCEQTYPTTMEDGPKYWYLRWTVRQVDTGEVDPETGSPIFERARIQIPSTYCKSCEKQRVVESRRIHHDIAKLPEAERPDLLAMMGGVCDCCGALKGCDERKVVMRGDGAHLVCSVCFDFAGVAHFDAVRARECWMRLFKHNSREQQLNALHAQHSDRRRVYHSQYPREDGLGSGWRKAEPADIPEGIPARHVQCIWQERVWRHVMRWLEDQSIDHAQGVDESGTVVELAVARASRVVTDEG